jgi:cell wall-associated NlpC family hydrolase
MFKLNIKKAVAVMVAASAIVSFTPFQGEQAYAATNTQKVISAGKDYLGTPYDFGSSRRNTRTFDCSDFTRQAFLDGLNIKIPSDSRKQASYVKSIGKTTTNWEKLKPGDLMFFMSYKGSKKSYYSRINKSKQIITHVGIYLGNGKILHTYSKKSGGVRIDKIDGTQWENRFVFGGSTVR